MDAIVCDSGLNKDSPYTYVNGVLRDGDGDEIKLVDPRKDSMATSTSAGASPQIQTPVRRKRSANVTPAFLGRNLRLGATMSPVSRRKRLRRTLSLGTKYRLPVRTRTTIARTKRLKVKLLQVYESIMLEEERRVGTQATACLLYTSPSPRDYAASRMPSSA